MELISVIALICVLIASAVYIYFKKAYNYWQIRGIPFEQPHIPFGNIQELGKKHQSVFTKRIYDKFKNSAKYCGIFILAGPVALILDLDLIKSILIKDFSNFSDKGFYCNETDDPLSAHLFTLDGDKWKKLRNKLTSTFTSGKMKFMFPTVVEVGERLNDCLTQTISQNDVVEIKDLLARFTCDVIGTCAFGIECNSLNDPDSEFKKMGHLAFIPKHPQIVGLAIHGMRNISQKLRLTITQKKVSKFFLNMVHETVAYREKNNISRNDFMDLLIKLKNDNSKEDGGLTLNEVAAQAFLFFAAGFETSSSTMMFCLYELALNPDIQTNARRVIQEAYEKHGQFTYEMMLDIPYIDHILQEALRKYPPVSVINRMARNDYNVPGTNHVIEKGTAVFIPSFAIQRDPDYYPDPEKFDPDRFENEEVKRRHPMAWLPFGEGPRNCIGLRFGMMQSRIGLVTLLKNFEFSLSSKTVQPLTFISNSFVLIPEGGVFLKLKKLT